MDMEDYYTDSIFTDFDGSDFIGGIDNEALDFGHLIDETNNNNNTSNSSSTEHPLACHTKAESSPTTPTTTTNNNSNNNIRSTNASNIAITTVSARVNLTSTNPIATPNVPTTAIANAANTIGHNSQATPHLPESPPDSGSEPPYSPLQDVHGLTLTSRDLFNGLSSTSPALHELQHQQQHQQQQQQQQHHMLPQQQQHPQFTPPHQHHFSHLNIPNHLNTSPPHGILTTQEGALGIRIKHEAGLIMNPASLIGVQQQQQQQQMINSNNPQNAHHNPNDAHIEILPAQQQLMYQNSNGNGGSNNHTNNNTNNNSNNLMQYESVASTLYPAASYQNIAAAAAAAAGVADSPTTLTAPSPSCMLTSLADVARVQVVGQINRHSAPSTPQHQSTSSRKRKLSTQIDCPDFPNIKTDPSLLVLSPVGSAISSTSSPSSSSASHHNHQHPLEARRPSPTSPVSIHLPTSHGNDLIASTPAHSAASLSPALSTINSNPDTSMDGGASNGEGGNGDPNALTPCIRFSPFQPQNWHKLCDQSLQELSVVYYRVDADKGFNFSVSDDAFVCQKKNHFQITCHARLQGEAKFVKTPSGLEKIKSFHLHFYGVKFEAPNQTIRVEQSQSDRSKKPFYPVPIDLQSHIVSKVTVGRLHFSETTNNNMRKKGRPNPEQRYFQLVVGLHVHTMSGNFPVISQGSERIIVRASNPGQFESDVDLCWQRGLTQDSIFHAGRVGINTDRPDESLVVHGNLKVSGHIVQPSDSRAKREINELDTSVQLRNLQKIRIVRYRYEPEFAIHSGLKRAGDSDTEDICDTGVIAQEVREVIPDAVKEAGSIVLPNGNVIENFLLVNKDRILMENIGAVKELCKVTNSLETRLEDLERMNNRLVRAKEYEQKSLRGRLGARCSLQAAGSETCSNRALQIIIFLLVVVMAACLAAVSTLYFMEHNKRQHNMEELEGFQSLSNGHYFHHDSVMITDQDRNFIHNILASKNKTHSSHWPSLIFAATTTRSPAPNSSSSKQRHELAYNKTGELYTSHGRNDELAVVMEKPVVSLLQPQQTFKESYKITTSAPQTRSSSNNKTISSKNKSKWPLPQVVIRNAAAGSGASQQILLHAADTNANIAPPVGHAENEEQQPSLNASETSSEKVADSIPLPQDFENNSIDIDAQHVTKRTSSAVKNSIAARLTATLNDAAAANEPSSVVESGDADITLKLSDHIAGAAAAVAAVEQHIASTSSSNSLSNRVPETTAHSQVKLSNGVVDGVIYNVYKTVSPPSASLALTTNKITTDDTQANTNYSIETPPISNKSQGVLDSALDNTDALDLQNLSSNNDSVDNPLTLFGFNFVERLDSVLGGHRSPAQRSVDRVIQRSLQVETFGAPPQCVTKKVRDDISNCQSVCFEDSNQLPPLRPQPSLSARPADEKTSVNQRQQQNVDIADIVDTEDTDATNADVAHDTSLPQTDINSTQLNSTAITTQILPGKTSHSTQAFAKEFSNEQHSDETENLDHSSAFEETIPEHSLIATADDDDVDENEPLKVRAKTTDEKSINIPLLTPSLTIEAIRPPVSDCWKVATCILADNTNNTFSLEDFCPTVGKSMNLTYTIPLSRYFKEPTVEVHFSSTTPLRWTICNYHEHTKTGGKPLASPSTLPFRRNTSILFINIQSRGNYDKTWILRGTNDFEKQNVCQEKAHEGNVFLQYNIRILRDCD